MSVRRIVGIVLLALSFVALVQTAREVAQSVGAKWTESPVVDTAFTFAGRSIRIAKPPRSDEGPARTWVPQERVQVDGLDIGAATGLRMATWPYRVDRRSPHWFDAVTFVDRAGRDSSLWIARRLQAADTVAPRFEVITLDATGHAAVQLHTQDDVRGEYRLSTVTALVAEDSRPEFPLSVVNFVWFPYLILVFPIGTCVLGIALLRRPRVAP